MELQRVVWHWPVLVERLRGREDDLARALDRSCRPLEAERAPDGQLTLVISSWFRPDFALLVQPAQRDTLTRSLGKMLEDQLKIVAVAWPGGWASGPAVAEQITPPDLLQGLGDAERLAAQACESPIQRYFFSQACRSNLRFQCQFRVGDYRIDFAIPEKRIGVEVVGWGWHRRRGSGMPGEREEYLNMENWRVKWLAGEEVVEDVERCVDDVASMMAVSEALPTRRYRGQATNGMRRPLHSDQGQAWRDLGRRRKR